MINLNLLPPERKKNYAYALLLERCRPAVIAATIIAALGAAGVQGIHILLNQKAAAVSAEVSAARASIAASEAGSLSSTVTQLNQQLRQLGSAAGSTRAWSAELAALVSTVPADAPIASISLTADGTVTMSGVAKSRAAFLALDEALKKNASLSKVATSSSASKRENIPYVYTASFVTQQP